MHTLNSEPYVFDDSDASHETITDTFDQTVALLEANADDEVCNDIVSYLLSYGRGYIDGLKTNGASTNVIIQTCVERPVLTHNQDGETVLGCMVGIYAANRSDADEQGGADAKLLKAIALTLDPETRRITGRVNVAYGCAGMFLVH